MMELKKYKLGDITEIQTGPFGSQLHNEDYVQDGTPIVTVEHLGSKEFSTQNLPLVSNEDKHRLHKYILKENDIVFSRVGSVDRCSFVSKKEDGWLFSGRCLRVRPKSIVNAEYLYYLLCTDSMKSFIRNKAVGATMPSLNTELLSNLPVTLLPFPVQQKIASVLSSLDKKIALNKQINQNLEALARQLYDYWFVQFDFPNEEGKPYKSSGGKMVYNQILKREIPEGWEVKKIGDIATTFSGGTPTASKQEYYKNGTIPWINSGELNEPFITKTSNFISELGYQNSSAKWYKEQTILIALYGATAGKVSLLSFPATSNQAVCGIMPNNKDTIHIIRYYLTSLYPYFISLSSGSARDNISQEIVRNTKIALPNELLIKMFHNNVEHKIKLIIENQKQIASLTKQRDELLPLLMNGQVVVD